MLGATTAARNGGWKSILGQFEFPELAGRGQTAFGNGNAEVDIPPVRVRARLARK
jgi:hypothetical protein